LRLSINNQQNCTIDFHKTVFYGLCEHCVDR
jgi:hypothetical protein